MRNIIASTLICLTLAACGHRGGPILYETPMGNKPWVLVQERQDEIALLSEREQKMVNSLGSLLQRRHDATGYPLPDQTFRVALQLQYGVQFDQAVSAAAVARAALKE